MGLQNTYGDTNPLSSIHDEVSKVFNESHDAVVRVEAVDRFGPHAGTGFLIDPHGTIFTQCSLALDSWDFTVEFEGKKYPATCLLADRHSGVAILKANILSTPFLPLGNSDAVTVAEPILVIGYPLDLPVSPNLGIVAGFDQKVMGGYLLPTHFRVSLPIERGEQGAPLLDLQGKVVGMIVGSLFEGHNTCYVLPIKAVEKVYLDYTRFGKAAPGFIGVTLDSSPPGQDKNVSNENNPPHIAALDADTPAAKSGLQAGDTVLQIGDFPIKDASNILDASFYITAGQDVPIMVERQGQKQTFIVKAVDHPTYSHMGISSVRPLEDPPQTSEAHPHALSIHSSESIDQIEASGNHSLLPQK